jgi:hypothetical protein
MASNNPVALCHPLLYGRCAAPSKKDGGALEGKTNDYAAPAQGQHRDVGPAGPVTSVAIGPVRPSPPSPTPSWELHHHPQHCGGTGRQDAATPAAVQGDKTPPRRLLCTPWPPVNRTLESMYGRRPNRRSLQHHPRSRSWTDTGPVMTPREMQDLPGRPSTPRRCTPCLYT